MRKWMILGLFGLSACAGPSVTNPATEPVRVKIIAFNDFHGALQPPGQAVPATASGGAAVRIPAGGAAHLASAITSLKATEPNNVVVSAGDLISASPLESALFLDEPTILAMNRIGLDFNAVGNHEFDRGSAELLRMQNGGCAKHGSEQPCRVDPEFPGASFDFLAANVVTPTGDTLFPGYALKRFGEGSREVTLAFIGLTLKDTATLVTPTGVAGLSFRDEAETINALVPRARADGADAIVVLIHQGLSVKAPFQDKNCEGMDGGLLPVLSRLDPEVDLVVSGHTHNAYVCDYAQVDPSRPFLVTSAGRNGTLLTDILLSIDPAAGKVLEKRAETVIVQNAGYEDASGPVLPNDSFAIFPADRHVAAIVDRYAKASAPIAARIVGRLAAPALRTAAPSGESVAGNLVADAYLWATQAAGAGEAQIAFTGQPRSDIIPGQDGQVTFGQLFQAQPYANDLVTKTMSGASIRAVLEQQFASGSNTIARPVILQPSSGLTYAYDLRRPAGQRIADLRLGGMPIDEAASYRVTVNSFLSAGGDNFTAFRDARDPLVGLRDVAALENYFASSALIVPPKADRIARLSP